MVNFGAQALSDSELLAIILRSGGRQESAIQIAQQLLKNFGGFKELAETDIKQLINYKNIGVAKACAIKAACEISLRVSFSINTEKICINKPKDIFELLRKDFFNKKQEHLYMISMDSRNKLITKDLISVGTLNETLIHPREIFKKALAINASSIALAHNHPSGDPTPSSEDISVTQRIAKIGIEMGIPLLDHIIIAEDTFVSIKALNLFERR
jgi:DNA repair protein RadC